MRRLSIFAVSLLLCQIVFAERAKPRMEDVASKLSCFCGGCPHLVVTKCGCSDADKIMADVQTKIDAGMSEQQILAAYVAQYGNTVLSAPPKSGFNLTAWILPFLAFALGGVFLFAFLRRQRSDTSSELAEVERQPVEEDRYRKQLLRELDERR